MLPGCAFAHFNLNCCLRTMTLRINRPVFNTVVDDWAENRASEPQEAGRKPELSLCGHSQHATLLICAHKKHHSVVAYFSPAILHIDWFQKNVLHCFSQCSCTAWSFPSPVGSGNNVKNVRTENSHPLHLTLHDHLNPSFIWGIFDNVYQLKVSSVSLSWILLRVAVN